MADLQDLVQSVGNEDDRDVLIGDQVVDDFEELLGLRNAQRRGRLVEDQEIAGGLDRSRDEDHLFFGKGQLADEFVDIQVNVEPLQRLFRFGADIAPIDDRLVLHAADDVVRHDILGDGLVRDQRHVYLLVDDLDAQLLCSGRVAKFHRFPIKENLPSVSGVRTGKDLHERGFSRSVGPYHCAHFPAFNGEIDIVQRFDARKFDGDMFCFKSVLFHDFLSVLFYDASGGYR